MSMSMTWGGIWWVHWIIWGAMYALIVAIWIWQLWWLPRWQRRTLDAEMRRRGWLPPDTP